MSRSTTALLALLAVFALGLTGCSQAEGDDGDQGVASLDKGSESDGDSGDDSDDETREEDFEEQALKFSECMRENGVPEFPDPELNGEGGMMMNLPQGIDREAMEKASEACEEFRPQGGGNFSEEDRAEMEDTMLEYAGCMRENGVPDFPDPDFSEGGARLGGMGIDPEDPAFEKAHKACEDILGDGPMRRAG
ncbi:hypothetical protein [Nocardioides speluncae]|uniref:hypothetical protein n=1 Tax=Nocardioides speluncae TaxID=2670337 RepID=UPI000D6A01D5|nr:hypothetical protein [Nocardioides speluncae]